MGLEFFPSGYHRCEGKRRQVGSAQPHERLTRAAEEHLLLPASYLCKRRWMEKRDVEGAAMTYAQRYLKHCGYKVTDVARMAGHNGYDLLAQRDGENLRIEVKGCTREWGIPDPFFTEFDSHRRLVADYLYVVYFLDAQPARLCVIPREAIAPEMVRLKQCYIISSRFKKASMMQQYMRPAIPSDD